MIDEIFTCNILKLTRLREFIISHARMADGTPRKFYAAGDPYQNLPIESNALLFKHSKEKREYIMDAVAALFPFQLTLRVCKRLTDPREQQLLEQIRDRLFEGDEKPSEVVCDIATPIFDVKDVQGLAICYKRATANAVNARMHALSLVGRTDVLKVGDKAYYPGLVLVCLESTRTRASLPLMPAASLRHAHVYTPILISSFCIIRPRASSSRTPLVSVASSCRTQSLPLT